MKLSEGERVILAMQLRILGRLYPKRAKKLRAARRAVSGGYVSQYEAVFASLGCDLYDEVSEECCRLVTDIFNMYRAIKFSNDRLNEAERLSQQQVHFRGFDEHEDEDLRRYARFLTKTLGRYRELTWRGSINGGAVMPMRSYRRMLEKWREWGTSDLTRAQIEELLALGPRQ